VVASTEGTVRRLGDSRRRWGLLGALALLALLVLVAMLIQGRPVYDDPYILFRFADNVARGHGWSFNAHTTTDNAATSTLSVLLLASGRVGGAPIPAFAAVLFFVATWGTAALTGLTLERLGHRIAGVLAAVMLAVSPALTAVWGMESSLYLCLLAAALWCAASRRPAWNTGLLLGFAALARPDGVVVGAALVLMFFVVDRSRRLTGRSWVGLVTAAATPVIAWSAFALWQFGDALPSTLAAKQAQAASGRWPLLLSSNGAGLDSELRGLVAGWDRVGELLLMALFVTVLLGIAAVVLRHSAWQVATTLVLATLAILVLYGVAFRIPSYPWYWVLPIYTMSVLSALGLEFAVTAVDLRVTTRTVIVAALAFALVAVNLHELQPGPNPTRTDYEYVGNWLRHHTAPDATVAATEVGKLGWFSERDMVDYLGLLDHRAIDHVRNDDYLWWAAHYQPDYWVTDGHFVDEPFLASACFTDHFEAVLKRPQLTVYHRTSTVPPPGNC